MGFFDIPHNGFGSHPDPVMIFTEVGWNQIEYVKDRCKFLNINFERAFRTGAQVVFEEITPGIIVYYPQYNCIRTGGHISTANPIHLNDFSKHLRKHPKILSTYFVKTQTIDERNEVISFFEADGYRKHKFFSDDHKAVFVHNDLKTLVLHLNKTADDNASEGAHEVIEFKDFKMYMR
jgi:hypothetical protein